MSLADPVAGAEVGVEDAEPFEDEGWYINLPSPSQEYILGKKQSPPHLCVGTSSMTGHKKSPS